MGNVNIELPEELHKKVKVVCALTSKTIIDFVSTSLEKKLGNEKEARLR